MVHYRIQEDNVPERLFYNPFYTYNNIGGKNRERKTPEESHTFWFVNN